MWAGSFLKNGLWADSSLAPLRIPRSRAARGMRRSIHSHKGSHWIGFVRTGKKQKTWHKDETER